MKTSSKFLITLLSALTMLSMAFTSAPVTSLVPVTGNFNNLAVVNTTIHPATSQSLDTFVASVKNGNSSQLTGVYVAGSFGFPVVQQPSGSPAYVSTTSNTLTQFGMASQYGSVGILAHNFLAGQYFSSFSSGKVITLVFGNGSTKNYTVSAVKQFQALNPESAYSQFVDLSNPSKKISSTDLFLQTFGLSGALVMQTCISKNGNSSWGRLFVVAYPS